MPRKTLSAHRHSLTFLEQGRKTSSPSSGLQEPSGNAARVSMVILEEIRQKEYRKRVTMGVFFKYNLRTFYQHTYAEIEKESR